MVDDSILRAIFLLSFFHGRWKTHACTDYAPSLATFIDDSHLLCELRLSDLTAGGVQKLYISNDDGQRWVSGSSIDAPIRWRGGSLFPVVSTLTGYPSEVVLGAMVPTDLNPEDTRIIDNFKVSYEHAWELLVLDTPYAWYTGARHARLRYEMYVYAAFVSFAVSLATLILLVFLTCVGA